MYRLLIPFAILHIRYIQWQYKKITINNYSNRNSILSNKLFLLQAKEYYYKQSFSSWGYLHGQEFSYTNSEMVKHLKFLNWLFPDKDFNEWSIVVWHKPEAVTYYHNKIYDLSRNGPPLYEIQIIQQIRKWKYNSYRQYFTDGELSCMDIKIMK